MDDILGKLLATTGAAERPAFEEACRLVQDAALEADTYPSACFEILEAVLTNRHLFRKHGSEKFLFNVLFDSDKFTANQRQFVLGAVKSHFNEYDRKELYWSVCDHIGRSYSPKDALDFVASLWPSATESAKAGISFGLDCLFREHNRDPALLPRISAILTTT